ncbi:uncharacterized protein Tco025E_09890, partial [Trypanosoma conorhini]
KMQGTTLRPVNDAGQFTAPRPRLMVLTSEKGWPCLLQEGTDMKDCYVNREADRVWRIVQGDLSGAFGVAGQQYFGLRRRLVIGTPGMGASMSVGFYLLHQLLRYDAGQLRVVVYCFGGDLAYVFDTTSKTVSVHGGADNVTELLYDLAWPPAKKSHLDAVLGLWTTRTPQRGTAASTTETKTTSLLEKVPRRARRGEVKRSACRPADKTARPIRFGHSVDITRCGDVHKNPGPDEDGSVVVWQLNIAGLSPVKNIALAARLARHQPDIVLLQEVKNQSATATKFIGYTDFHQARGGRGGGVAVLVRHTLPCECLTLPGTDPLEAIAVCVFLPAFPSICVVSFYNPPPALAHAAQLASIVRRLGSAAIVAGDVNLHHELWDSHLPPTEEAELLAAALVDTGFEIANDLAQATRLSGRSISSPDVTAYRALRVSHWSSTPYLDSDHCLISYSVGTEDGVPRLANALPRRKKATFALRKADWPAFTSQCEALLASVSTWPEFRRCILRAAKRTIPRGSLANPKTIWTDEMEQAESTLLAAFNAHLASPGDSVLRAEFLRKREDRNLALRRGFTKLLEARAQRLGADSSPSWRYLRGMAAPRPHPLESVVLRSSRDRVCALPRQQANLLVRHFVRVSRAPAPLAASCTRCLRLPPGEWEMDRPFTPYELDLAIRDSSHGTAPGPDAILNEFLQHLGPVARGTLRTMINICLADGCVPMPWKIGETIPVPKFGKDPCRAESYRPITLLSALLKVTEKMVHRRLSALLPHHPRQFGFVSSRRTSDVVTLVLDRITRGLNEFSMVEYERPSGGAPSLHPRRHRSLVVLIDFSTAFDTIDHGKLLVMLDRLPRLGPRTKRWLRNYLRGRYVRVRVREQTSRLQLTSAGVPQGSVLGPQLFSITWMTCCA